MRILASNYDGTLCYGKKVMAEDSEAIRKWQEAGNLFVIVTGRAKESLDKYLDKDGIRPDYYVTNNGSVIYDAQGNILKSDYMDYTTAIDTIFIAKQTEGVASYVVNDGLHRHRIIVNGSIQDRRYPNMQEDLSEEEIMNQVNFSQIVLSMANSDYAEELANDFNLYFSENIQAYANNYCVDIVAKGVSKGTGLEYVAMFADVDMDDVYAVGNLQKDMPMLEITYNRYAFFTAPEEIKDLCEKECMSIHDLVEEIL